ncbi:BadF/BadG/BcrA/BcrD ATPase family protein [Trinickia dinghuensis]|uniref:ATPase n=1 Tax=Trinickia dinghuensis TaxID=2291023 RepID=A0A3D8JNG9_9BURK|nr:BadF/BadG/BcrA/BcrD ATPase family protein [Trinickia dinghuensis]RDU94683.1 ATPase [Trinickia dinghuensis]
MDIKSEAALLFGVDGGGTGTRLMLSAGGHAPPIVEHGGPSALSLGARAAWKTLEALCRAACERAGIDFRWERCVIAAGMAGAHHVDWKRQFVELAPPLRALRVETDATMTLAGAHGGRPGAIIALGTGSVGESVHADGTRISVGGYGFPAGDEASGAWLGLRAARHLQYAFDGRAHPDSLSQALQQRVGVGTREALVEWLMAATAGDFARLAPAVVLNAAHPFAYQLLCEAGAELATMARALDPGGTLPLALCGGLGRALSAYLPEALRARLVEPRADAVAGALAIAADISHEINA